MIAYMQKCFVTLKNGNNIILFTDIRIVPLPSKSHEMQY